MRYTHFLFLIQRSLPGLLVYLLLLTGGCTNETPSPVMDTSTPGYTLPYRLDQPDTVFKMPDELCEISGLSMSPDGRQLIAVNDEKALVFYLNAETGAVERTREFGKNNDYEGLEAVGSDIYVVKSNGTLYRIPESGETQAFPTFLNSDNNVEGLAYDPAGQRLLLACKGRAGKGAAYDHKKAIYAFDVSTHTLNETPAFVLDVEDVARRKGASTGFWERLFDFIAPEKSVFALGLSGLAYCPADSNLYLVASVGKTLAVLHPDGRLLHAQYLDADVFRQPEGICFDAKGRMYISSEGKKKAGRIMRFQRQQ